MDVLNNKKNKYINIIGKIWSWEKSCVIFDADRNKELSTLCNANNNNVDFDYLYSRMNSLPYLILKYISQDFLFGNNICIKSRTQSLLLQIRLVMIIIWNIISTSL